MEKDFNIWADEKGPIFFKKIGIGPGQKILDFGSGWGSNALALARLVAPMGYVYALEKEKDSIDKLRESAKARDIENIRIIEDSEEGLTYLEDGELNGALLFDVIHDYYFDQAERVKLFREMYRIIKKEGLLSVYPHHICEDEVNKIKQEIAEAGFTCRDILKTTVLHDSTLIQDRVLNFVKDYKQPVKA
jgi:ubiquinone/menaquinone biosynthesis C-methylase UbiE